ncbi:MAG TPA: hypothetical protein VF334_16935 [Polyangia bacterium]
MTATRIFLFLFCAFMLLTSREPPWADAHVVYDTTENFVDNAALDVRLESGPPWFYAHRNGKKYGVFPLGNVIAMVPSYVTYKLVTKLFKSLPDKPIYALAAHVAPSLMMAAACALFFVVARRRGLSRGWATGATMIVAFATLTFVYARSPYSEALQTLVLMWLVERTLAMGERPTTAGIGWLAVAAGVLVNSKLVNVLFLPFVAWYVIDRAYRRRELDRIWRALPLALFVFAEFSALLLWHNYMKTGSLFDSGYQIKNGVFSGDLFAGLYGLLLSTGKSAFLYSPPLILAVLGARTAWQRRRAETAFLVVIIAVSLLFNAKFRHWHADYCWGPRHLTAVTPMTMLLAFPWLPEALQRGRVRLRKLAFAGLVAWGVHTQLLGASIYWDHYIRALIAVKDQTGAGGWFQEHLSHGHYIPAFSPLRGQRWLLHHLVHDDPDLDRDAPWKSIVPFPSNTSETWTRIRLDWWLLEFVQGDTKRPKVAAALLLLMLAATATTGVFALRRPRRDDERQIAAAL